MVTKTIQQNSNKNIRDKAKIKIKGGVADKKTSNLEQKNMPAMG